MIQYQLKHEDLIEHTTHTDFKIIEATDNNIIEHCINLFSLEIQWDNMFNIEQSLQRIERGEKMFVGYKNEDIFYLILSLS